MLRLVFASVEAFTIVLDFLRDDDDDDDGFSIAVLRQHHAPTKRNGEETAERFAMGYILGLGPTEIYH